MSNSTVQLVVRTASGLAVRPEPVRISWVFDDLVASDGHKVRCTFTAALRALDRPAELQMLCESVMQGSASVTADMVKCQWTDPLRSSAAGAIKSRTGEDATADAGRSAVAATLTDALNRLAFGCGIEILPPCQVDTESPTLTRQRVEAMRQQAAQQRTASQLKQLEQAAALLSHFEHLRQASPQLSAGRILHQLAPAEQTDMLQSLLLASSQKQQTQSLWAVAGQMLLQIDPSAPAAPPRSRPMPQDLGPIRSVNRCDDGTLLVGARSGVYVSGPSAGAGQSQAVPPVPSPAKSGGAHSMPDTASEGTGSTYSAHAIAGASLQAYADPGMVSQMGFSHALRWGEELWACHSEAGIAGWKLDAPNKPHIALRPPQLNGASPRNLAALDSGRLIFSSGPRLMMLLRQDGDHIRVSACGPDSPSEIIAVLHAGDAVVTALRSGEIEIRQIDDLDVVDCRTVAGMISAACLLPWLGEWRILLAEESGPVSCVGLTDTVVTRFSCSYRGLKALAAAADVVTGVTADRQRIIWWQTTTPAKLAGDTYIMPAAKHRAADVAV
ncbi:MAG: hypothetical protein ABSH20_03955 [Tepidisphaeraceae bacterium]|jgi:hypothetical protein